MSIITAPIKNGGLNVADVCIKDASLKAQWSFKCINNDAIKTLAYTLMDNPIGDLLWKCHLVEKDIWDMPPFWKNVLQTWAKLNFDIPYTACDVMHEVIWFNSNVRHCNKVMFVKNLFQNGLVTIGDMVQGFSIHLLAMLL